MDALTGEFLPISHDIAWIPVEEPSAVGRARRTVAGLAERLAFPAARTAEIEIAVSELGSNLSRHAEQGVLLVRSVHTADEALVEVVTMDRGPGIPDVGAAVRDGHSTAGTLGIGLGAVHRLADSCEVVSSVGTGTVLVARFRPHRGPTAGFDAAAVGVTRPITGEDVCGDGYAVRRLGDRLLLMMCDGAGHGPLAATASRRAVRAFCDAEPAEPDVLVRLIDAALVGSRGGAVAVADLRPATGAGTGPGAGSGIVRYAGVGNIAGSVVDGRHKRGMVSLPGIAGHRMRTLRVFDYELPPDAAVILHSDGLSDRWTADVCDGMLARGPLVTAMVLLRAAGTRRDDASVLVARAPR